MFDKDGYKIIDKNEYLKWDKIEEEVEKRGLKFSLDE